MKNIIFCTVCGTQIKGTSLTCLNGCIWNKEDQLLSKERYEQYIIENHPEVKEAFNKLIYCLEGFSEEYGNENYGDAQDWMRHVYNSYKKYSNLKEELEEI